ncbi:PepSY domain-containing protein [Streptomyces sp. 15-116A]|uniref:PepSY domain-containing protein n=1 Tax=Streptomyces sp. 15-116A TaxID=2259035 RepID=UPI0021B22C76|nr:PepSY domain-containing protein [Streptomyces sp. 15-116A]MCT7356779.1 PepSY domain-containing protein [Streptomyces sp. 15-116A]
MKRNIVIAVVTAAALLGGGTATALAVSGDDDATPTSRVTDDKGRDDDGRDDDGGREDDPDEARAAASADVTAAEAIAAALKHTPGTAVSADLDGDEGRTAWEVDVLGKGDTWHSVRIDPASGKVLSAHEDDEDDTAEVRAALKGASVSAEDAARAAAAKGTVTSVDLDDDGEKVWEVETSGAGDWKVALNTAKVTPDREDSDDSGDND